MARCGEGEAQLREKKGQLDRVNADKRRADHLVRVCVLAVEWAG